MKKKDLFEDHTSKLWNSYNYVKKYDDFKYTSKDGITPYMNERRNKVLKYLNSLKLGNKISIPEVFILDECTNSLDLETEKQIINEVNSFKGEKTIIMITHRLSTLENCDHIYKIDRTGLKLERT